MLLNAGSKFNAIQSNTVNCIDSPLHTAMELEYLDIAKTILNAGGSIKQLNNAGETPLHVCIRKKSMGIEIFSNHYLEDTRTVFDLKDKNGYTVLHAAIKAAWISGVYIALENRADITLQANNGDAPIHAAAEVGDIGILNELLSIAQRNNTLDYQNKIGETALFKAIIHGHRNCVEVLLKKGASVFYKLPGNFNVLHIAAKYGCSDILQILLRHNDVITNSMIDKPTTEHERLSPLHLAVIHDHPDCVKLLLNNSTNNCLQINEEDGSFNPGTPLYIAAVKNRLNIAHILLEHDISTLHETDSCNWTPLHAASFYGNEDIILLFIRKGADITLRTKGPNNFKKTCVDLIMTNVSKPTQFMEDLLDSYIYSDESTHVAYFVNVDYRILTTNLEASEQMKVVETLLKTGNRFGQSRLLVHPLIESFLYLNWVYLLPFFYIILGLYGLYVLSLNIFIISTYFFKDTKDVPPAWLNPVIWRVFIYITGALILLQEFLYIHFGSKTYFYRLESWIKIATIVLAMLIPIALSYWPDDAWTRHVTTVTLLLSWTEMLFILSRFPNWGYYVLMFGKVLSKVLKILLTFVFLIIGFALSFMVQFHSQAPFNNPWTAFVKTTVMMTSEFDYLDLFDDKQIRDLAISFIVIRILFLIFLILGGIVLMNLMVGVAVNDLHNLEIHGNIKRLEKQVEFLSSLESVVYNKFLIRYLPSCLTVKRKIFNNIILSAVDYELLPLYLKDAIFHKAQALKAKRGKKLNPEVLNNKNRKSSLNSNTFKFRPIDLGYNKLIDIGGENKYYTDRDAMVELKERMEHIFKEIEIINTVLRKINNLAS